MNVTKLNFQVIGFIGIVCLAIIAFLGNYLFEQFYEVPVLSPEVTPSPQISIVASISPAENTPGPEVTMNPSSTVKPTVTATFPTIEVTPIPTLKTPTPTQPKATVTLRPTTAILPTSTPVPQNIQATGRFFEYALCKSTNLSQVNQIISNATTQLAQYDDCEATVDQQTQDCMTKCSVFDTSCQEQCATQASNSYENCKSSYCDPPVDEALGNLTPYCSWIQPSCEALKCCTPEDDCDC